MSEPTGAPRVNVVGLMAGNEDIFSMLRAERKLLDAMVAAGVISASSAVDQLRKARSHLIAAMLEHGHE